MNGRIRVLLLLSLVVALLPLAVSSPMSSLALQPVPERSPDLIHALYATDPARRRLPMPDDEPARPAEEAPLGVPSAWSRLAFFSFRDDNWDVYLVDPDGSDQVRLTSEVSRELYPSLRRGGDRVLFSSDRDSSYEIYAVDADGSDLQRLTHSGGTDTYPAWSPDGTRIAWESHRTGGGDVYVMNADGSNVIRLTTSEAYDGQPSWSPDGAQIVFVSARSGGFELWIMNADGTDQHQVTNIGSAFYPAWSPGGDKIAFSADGDGNGWLEVWQMDADGSNAEMLYSAGGATDIWGPAWSPDGLWLALIETSWVQYQGHWYWTQSYLKLREVKGSGNAYPVDDDRIWKAHWVTTDTVPPGPCSLDVPANQRWSSFLMSWSAEDVGPAGIDAYEVQVRTSPTALWQPYLSWTSDTGGIYFSKSSAGLEFRCRARDAAGNQAGWEEAPVASISVDAVRPWSTVSPLPANVPGSTVLVSWVGDDRGSGLAAYDVWVREGTTGDWLLWQDGVTGNSAVFSGLPGQTYSFRSQARDEAGHLEPWQPLPQAVTTFYTHVLSGTISDQRGQVGVVPAMHLEPAVILTPPDPSSGAYAFYAVDVATYTLELSATGYAPLPPTEIYLDHDTRLDLVLPPEDEAVTNGGFEAGGLDGWSVSGGGAQAALVSRHTGAYGLQIGHALAATTELSQTIPLDPGLHQPTLSLLARIPSDLEQGEFSVWVTGAITLPVLQASEATPGWLHVWADLTPAAGQAITLTLRLADAVGIVEVDEVSVGSWQTPLIEGVSPAGWHPGQAPQLAILGQNFIPTPAVFLDGTGLGSITWVSPTLLMADAPSGLPAGTYDLTVVNPNGSAVTRPDAVTVGWRGVYLPLVMQGGRGAVSLSGADWPTLGQNIGHTGQNEADPGASRYALVWSVTLPYPGGRELESLAVADGVLVGSSDSYFGDAGVVALDAQTGAEIWRRPFSDKFSINPPSVAHGAVYFQEGNHGSDSYLFSLDLYTGAQHWRAPFSAQWETYLAPLVVGDAVYCNAGYYGGMYGFRAGSGERLWSTGLEQYDMWTPAYGGGVLYTWVEGNFRAHDPATGATQWALDLGWDWHGYDMDTTPAISGDVAVVASSIGLNAVNLATRAVRWKVGGNYDRTIPAVADGVVYALQSGMLEARRLNDGGLLWDFLGDHGLINAPVVAGEYVYVASSAQTTVLNRTTHEVEWQVDHGGWLAVADGFLYIGQPDKTVYAYRAQEP